MVVVGFVYVAYVISVGGVGSGVVVVDTGGVDVVGDGVVVDVCVIAGGVCVDGDVVVWCVC